jgi:hypothetical protein
VLAMKTTNFVAKNVENKTEMKNKTFEDIPNKIFLKSPNKTKVKISKTNPENCQ